MSLWDEAWRVGAMQSRAPLSVRKIFLLLIKVIAAHCENASRGARNLEIALQVSTTFLLGSRSLCVLPESRLLGLYRVHWLFSCSMGQDCLRASVALALELRSQSLGISRSGLEPENLYF